MTRETNNVKRIDDDVLLTNCDVIAIFSVYDQFWSNLEAGFEALGL